MGPVVRLLDRLFTGSTPPHEAAKRGDTNEVAALIRQGVHVDARHKDGTAPLHLAAQAGHETTVSLLLERGATVDIADDKGVTPLHVACVNKRTPIVRLLLSKGADVNAVNRNGGTALDAATLAGDVEIATLLLGHGADAKAPGTGGITPIHMAAASGQAPIVQLLVRHGADPNTLSADGVTPLIAACLAGHPHVAEVLIACGANLDATDQYGNTPLTAVKKHGYSSLADFSASRSTCTPPHGVQATLRFLMEKGAVSSHTNRVSTFTFLGVFLMGACWGLLAGVSWFVIGRGIEPTFRPTPQSFITGLVGTTYLGGFAALGSFLRNLWRKGHKTDAAIGGSTAALIGSACLLLLAFAIEPLLPPSLTVGSKLLETPIQMIRRGLLIAVVGTGLGWWWNSSSKK